MSQRGNDEARRGKREVLASSSGFSACRYSSRFSSTLMKPITLRLAKGTPLIAGNRRFWSSSGVATGSAARIPVMY